MSAVPSDVSARHIVLIVDDVPDNLMLLHDALDAAGYTVLVATNGEDALRRVQQCPPDVILLDAVMPGMDGFAVARRLKGDSLTRPIPIVFMTGLTESEHVLAAFDAGGADYVTKPLRPPEVLARIAAHVANARQVAEARTALDAFGQGTVAVDADSGRMLWQTPLAGRLLERYFGAGDDHAPPRLAAWLRHAAAARAIGQEVAPLLLAGADRRLLATLHDPAARAAWLVVLREESDEGAIALLAGAFKLTRREAEVLYWISLGKTNRDIADILGMSPRTVNKHQEHIFGKLGVETRTAAAGVAVNKVHGR
ncbi:response regulator [Paludibacterium yongneupense]|uniref:response regulator n=1 Tax=Paludibacterium yongneupense TaxID=400061 RepID=UPI00042310AF|nr:response regulator [Paludibacterium yongneupense]